MEAAAGTLTQPRNPIAEAGGDRLDRLELSHGQDRCSSTAVTEQRCACDHWRGRHRHKNPRMRQRLGPREQPYYSARQDGHAALSERPVKKPLQCVRSNAAESQLRLVLPCSQVKPAFGAIDEPTGRYRWPACLSACASLLNRNSAVSMASRLSFQTSLRSEG